MKTLPSTDVLIIGGGWTGLLMAKELSARTPVSIVVLERGRDRQPDYRKGMDELDYFVRLHMMQDPSRETLTMRHRDTERALPIRQFGAFLPGSGVGGTGEHWGAVYPRLLPDCFELHSSTIARYGERKLPEDSSTQDWGVTYDEMEPFYARSEREVGVSGKAGNLKGQKIEGGNVFEGWRSAEYPMPPTITPYFSELFRGATKSMGYHPYYNPTAVTSQEYTNPEGITRPACAFCGFCERTPCMIGAKSQPTSVLLPIVQKRKTVTLRTGATVRRIVHDPAEKGGKARGVTYVDESGEEVFQPADLVFLASYTLSNNHLLMLSKIGTMYDPATGKGTLGKNLTHQVAFGVQAFLPKPINKFMGAGGTGVRIADFDADVFDHGNLNFIRGGMIAAMSVGTQPLSTFGNVPGSVKTRWGAEWKKASIEYYDRTGIVAFSGEQIPYRGNRFDLDPSYKNPAGDPLLRMTINWQDNERKMVDFMNAKMVEISHAMGAKDVNPFPGYFDYDVTRYQSTHIQGGTMMAKSPDLGVVNTYTQHWDISNLFVLGASTFPNSGSSNPTPTILALTYRTADAIVDKYLNKPGMLA
ncbi:MAG TPA: GMC family oxidoreductase [Candidatus Acidoferrales bacterium]|jgi:gluconate 2-dehydrogenase alpha chain|nr:GMC family oxidoreductase [Candidatus Acidoferrales bacterium]